MGKRPEYTHHQKKYTDAKGAHHNMSLGNCKLKQWNNTTYLLEWPKSKTDNTKCWQGCGATKTFILCQGKYKMV